MQFLQALAQEYFKLSQEAIRKTATVSSTSIVAFLKDIEDAKDRVQKIVDENLGTTK